MGSTNRMRVGIQAGFLGGAAVAALFFMLDLLHLQPLVTPIALAGRILSPTGPAFDLPVVSQLLGVVILAGNVLALTLLHFLAFSFLGLGAVWGCEKCHVPLNVFTGALYGLIFGSAVYYCCMALLGQAFLANTPGPLMVAFANLTAGALMGGFTRVVRSRKG